MKPEALTMSVTSVFLNPQQSLHNITPPEFICRFKKCYERAVDVDLCSLTGIYRIATIYSTKKQQEKARSNQNIPNWRITDIKIMQYYRSNVQV